MKETFNKIRPEKRQLIIDSATEEFAEWGYEKGSTDRIISRSGISKGGLYEYISSKEDLFLFLVDHTYSLLYNHITSTIEREHGGMPPDLLDRFFLVASTAIDFYLQNPVQIKLIIQTGHIIDEDLTGKVRQIFISRFRTIFGDAERSNLRFDMDRLLELMEWLLLKTRNHFLKSYVTKRDAARVRREYLKEWEFILDVLKTGIYKSNKE